jgi:PQQ-like domain
MRSLHRVSALFVAGFLAAATAGSLGGASHAPATDGDKGVLAPVPLPQALWRKPLLRTDPETGPTAIWLQRAEKQMREINEPVLSPCVPVAVTRRGADFRAAGSDQVQLLVYRSHWGTHAVHMATGKLDWESQFDPVYAASPALSAWSHLYVAQVPDKSARPCVVFEGSSSCRLSADGTYLYTVEDFTVPPAGPFGLRFAEWMRPGANPGYHSGISEINDAIQHSRLQAFELATGKLKWVLDDDLRDHADANGCFPGPPLAVDGKLYTLVLRRETPGMAARLANPWLAVAPLKDCFWKTELLTFNPKPPVKLLSRPSLLFRAEPKYPIWQRLRGGRILLAGDTLICLTDRGVVIGVDRKTGIQQWEYHYPVEDDNQIAALMHPARVIEDLWSNQFPNSSWRVFPWWRYSSPVIRDDKLVFTPSFSRFVHCISVHDGKLLWKAPQADDDVYLAGVVGDTVLITGKKTVRALRLSSGEKMWEIATGMPSGYGAVRDGIYYLPLQVDADSKNGEIVLLDPAAGKVVTRFRADDGHTPGNLFFFDQRMISQSIREIAVYPMPATRTAP